MTIRPSHTGSAIVARAYSASCSGPGLPGGFTGTMWNSMARCEAARRMSCRAGRNSRLPRRRGNRPSLPGQGSSHMEYDGGTGMVLVSQRRQRIGPEISGLGRQRLGGQCRSPQSQGGVAELRAQQVLPVHASHPEDEKGVPVKLLAPVAVTRRRRACMGWTSRGTNSPSAGRPAGRGTWTGRPS